MFKQKINVIRQNHVMKYTSGQIHHVLANLSEMVKTNKKPKSAIDRFPKNGPSKAYLQVLGSGARGAPNALCLFTEHKCYLFNCGENIQRVTMEHNVNLSNLKHIFMTSKTWQNVGGLLGLSVTLQNIGLSSITLHAPTGLNMLYKATRKFIKIKRFDVNIENCSPNEDFEDDVLTIKYVHFVPHDYTKTDIVYPETYKNISVDKQLEKPMYNNHNLRNDKLDKLSPNKIKLENIENNEGNAEDFINTNMGKYEDEQECNTSFAFICSIKANCGKSVDSDGCVHRDSVLGPRYHQLQAGVDSDAVMVDRAAVYQKQMKLTDQPKRVFIVLEVPDVSGLRESEFAAHFDDGVNSPEYIPAIVVHFTPPHVFNNIEYQRFMSRFGLTTKHMVLNTQNSCLGSEVVHRIQHKLHLLDGKIFPLLRDFSIPDVKSNLMEITKFQKTKTTEGIINDDTELQQTEEENQLELIAAKTLTIFHMRPTKGLDRSAEPKLHTQDYIQNLKDDNGFIGSLRQFHQFVSEVRHTNEESQQEYPKIIFLGTGSGIPNEVRSCSGIVLQVDEKRSMLLDCGEGTFTQLVRFFGPGRVNSFLRTLKAAYVSHLHPDHHLGLIGVLQGRREAFEEVSQVVPPLQLLAPQQIFWWLHTFNHHFRKISDDYTLIPNQELVNSTPNPKLSSAMLNDMGLHRVVTCRVPHSPNSFGVALQIGQQKITYSGDTLPCDELVKIGENSTLLIHEATLDDGRAQDARKKMHSTTSQAIEVGRRMGARYMLLTHFSPRYGALPPLGPHILGNNDEVAIAFDNMQISLGDLEILPHMYLPLKLMFTEHRNLKTTQNRGWQVQPYR